MFSLAREHLFSASLCRASVLSAVSLGWALAFQAWQGWSGLRGPAPSRLSRQLLAISACAVAASVLRPKPICHVRKEARGVRGTPLLPDSAGACEAHSRLGRPLHSGTPTRNMVCPLLIPSVTGGTEGTARAAPG